VNPVAALAIVVMVGAMTYGMRAVVIVALADRTISPAVERALRSVGPAVLAALAVNLAAGGEGGGVDISVAEVAALVVAGGVAWWRRNVLIALSAGMVTLWVASALN
jgi:branched-subunit amino acid transport protein